MPESSQFTRWRSLANPVDAFDPIQADSPRYLEGHLPVGFVLLLFDGHALRGAMQFKDQKSADDYLISNPGILAFLVIPKVDCL